MSHQAAPRSIWRVLPCLALLGTLGVTAAVTAYVGLSVRPAERLLVPLVLAGGLLTSAALFIVLRMECQDRDRAERVAAELRVAAEERAALLEREKHALREAREANRAKDEFLAAVSHELRTPLNAILGWTQMLRRGQLDGERRAHALEVVERNARALAALVDDLLDVSRIVAGTLRLNLRPVEMSAAVQAALETARPQAEARHVEIVAALEATGRVMGDSERMQQVVANLLSNAVKFTPAGGRVEVRLARSATEMTLSVSDPGIGIPSDFLPHVFDPFRQADGSASRAHGGLGLGLAIVRHLVERMGGRITAESAGPGQGARFTVVLPLVTQPVSGDAARGPAVTPDPVLTAIGPRLLAGLSILVADDDEDSRELMADGLAQAGATVLQAASTPAARSILASSRVDVLVSDLAMPEADGLTLIRAVRTHEAESVRAIPAIALTANPRAGDRDRALEAGFQMYQQKPVDVLRLQSAVAWVTGRV